MLTQVSAVFCGKGLPLMRTELVSRPSFTSGMITSSWNTMSSFTACVCDCNRDRNARTGHQE